MRWLWPAVLFGVLVTCPRLAAQAEPAPAAAPGSLDEQVRAELEHTARRWVGVSRARVSYPQKVSLGLGVLAAEMPTAHECVAVCLYRGLVMQVEPGVGGGQLGIGYARLVGDRPRGSRFLANAYVGWGVRAALLRTWGESGLTPRDQTLAGIEGQFSIARVGFSVGVLRRLSPDRGGGDDYLVTGGIGWGF